MQTEQFANASPMQLYGALLDGIMPLEGTWKLYEIVSDGAGHLEPFWHGFEVDKRQFYFFEDEERSRLAKEIRIRRNEHGEVGSHRDLGRVLVEPVLFAITGQRSTNEIIAHDVWHHTPVGWQPLNTANALPLGKSIRDSSELEAALASIRERLMVLSSQVLWPVFWPDGDGDSYITLLCVQGSAAGTEAGVWALHASSRDYRLTRLHGQMSSIRDALDPALLSLTDVLATEYARDNTDARRRSDLRFFARCTISSQLNNESEIELDDDAIAAIYEEDGLHVYEQQPRADYIQYYGQMLDKAVAYLSGLSEIIGDRETPRPKIVLAIQHAFVAIRIAELHREEQMQAESYPELEGLDTLIQQSVLAALLFDSAERLCSEATDNKKSISIDAQQKVPSNHTRVEHFILQVREVLSDKRKQPHNRWLMWCSFALQALAGLARVSEGDEGFPRSVK